MGRGASPLRGRHRALRTCRMCGRPLPLALLGITYTVRLTLYFSLYTPVAGGDTSHTITRSKVRISSTCQLPEELPCDVPNDHGDQQSLTN